MWSTIRNVVKVPDLRNKILFTIFMIAIYRLGCYLPTPGIDQNAVNALKEQAEQGGVLSFLSLFSGRALTQFALFALGIMPYITSSIIMQILTVVIPRLQQWQEQGAVGLNAGTSMDSTVYFMSMPANRMELWMLMESSRFKTPVYREFYKERDVVREEYRLRIESDPVGKLINTMLSTAFVAHPYRIGPAGLPDDIETFRVGDAREFRKKYYTPSNMTISIAGDVDPKEVRRLAERYFGPLPAGPKAPTIRMNEPPQEGEKRSAVETPSQPIVLIGYKRPSQDHPDDPVFDVISGLLSQGRTSMFYRELVLEKKLVLQADTGPNFPGQKYPNLFIVIGVPNQGKTIEETEKALVELMAHDNLFNAGFH